MVSGREASSFSVFGTKMKHKKKREKKLYSIQKRIQMRQKCEEVSNVNSERCTLFHMQ